MKTAPRFVMIGGFLGAGKTTTVARLAQRFQNQGEQVVIVTNDQASDLVDTHLLRAQGFQVGEVAGSCFCCNFNELTATVERLGAAALPSVVIAEPVGSCTDLVATVIRPLQQVYARPLEIAPYGVIVKPSHGKKILGGQKGGFSPQAEYIFRKQIEEADFVILNRIDELSPAEVDQLQELVDREYPGRPLVRMSAKTGAGFHALCEFIDQQGEFGTRLMDVDYDVYAAGEAELGWLNAQIELQSELAFSLDAFLLDIVAALQSSLSRAGAETAHLKAIGMQEGHYAVVNLISNLEPPQLSLASKGQVERAHLVVNARVAISPEELTEHVEQALSIAARSSRATARIVALQSFRPGRPVPTHRLTGAGNSKEA